MRVIVLNGPNLNLLGSREPEVYGSVTLGDLETQISEWAGTLGVEASFLQSNHEGELVEAIHDAAGSDGIVINPGALTHTSRALGDALHSVAAPAVEVHISNVKERESWRAVSLVSPACVRTIYGRGIVGYRDAIRHLVNRAAVPHETLRYGPHPDNVGDLRLPAMEAAGLGVLVHGGFWRQEYERDPMETLAVDLVKRGWATWNIEYRRLGRGGGWPGSGQDVKLALDYIRQRPDMGSLAVAAIGHSAGGHLALWAANKPSVRPIGLTVGLAAVTDLASLAALGGAGSSEAKRLLGAGAPPVLDAPSPTLLVHGDQDELVPVSHSTRLGDVARVEIFPGLGHFDLLDPTREHWSTVFAALENAES
ncbi:MAG: type II 3-dehydroquinate dehydratase [Acidimicrobiia bacterium]